MSFEITFAQCLTFMMKQKMTQTETEIALECKKLFYVVNNAYDTSYLAIQQIFKGKMALNGFLKLTFNGWWAKHQQCFIKKSDIDRKLLGSSIIFNESKI